MRGNPVHYHADAALVQLIDKIHKILRLSEARGRRIIFADLIAPRAVIGMLCYRHQLNMGISHIGEISRKLVRYLAVIQVRVAVDVRPAVARFP